MPARRRFAAAASIMLLLAACTQQPPSDPRPDPGGDANLEVLIPPTTKVLDTVARDALLTFDDQGTLRFASESGVAGGLEIGDVVVSEPTAAAPFGLLRKVSTVGVAGQDIMVETVGAELREAVHQGSLSVSLELNERDLVRSTALQPGIEVQGFDYTIDTDFGTGGALRATGTVSVQPVLDLDLSLTCNERIGPLCVELPDLSMLFKVGLIETADLTIGGNESSSFDEEFVIASHDFAPITFTISVFPIVLTPRLEVYLTASGTISADLSFIAEQDLTLVGGFTYHDDRGFRNVSQSTVAFDRGNADFEGRAEVGAAVGARFQVFLYDLVGPFGALEAGPRIRADQAGLTGSATTLWALQGCVTGIVGLRSIPLLDLAYETDLFGRCVAFASETNDPPNVLIQSPIAATQIFVGDDVTLRGEAFDPNGHGVACTWTSSDAGDSIPGTDCTRQVAFATTGIRTLTLRGTDAAGASDVDTVSVNVQPQPAIRVTVTNPEEQQNVSSVDETHQLTGSASGGEGPYAFEWTIAYPTDRNGVGGETFEIGPGSLRPWIPAQTLDVDDCRPAFARLDLSVTDAGGFPGGRSVLISFGRIC